MEADFPPPPQPAPSHFDFHPSRLLKDYDRRALNVQRRACGLGLARHAPKVVACANAIESALGTVLTRIVCI